jgi:hypothetical protein
MEQKNMIILSFIARKISRIERALLDAEGPPGFVQGLPGTAE